jgi:amino acid adenylation domain-containing protein
VEHLAPARDLSRTPVFQVMLALQNEPLSQLTLPGLDVTVHAVENPTAKYDLVFTLRDGAPGITGVLEYNSDLFEPETVLEIRESLLHVLGAMAEGPDRDIQDLPLREAAATRELLTGWNLTPRYDPDTCLHDLVARQVAATPDAIAVICDESGQTLTYRELDRRAGQVTRLLRGQGVGPDDLVAVLLPRSADLVASLLGVLRCGAGFLPLDPGHPADRVRAILADAGVAATITTAELRDLVPGGGLPGPSPAGPGPGSLAYAIYTSGSTGRPKGVLIEHHAICGNLLWMQQDWPLDAHDRVLQKTTIAFDVAVKEIFWPLLSGAAVVLARPGGQRDAEYLIDLIDRHGITVAHFVPSMLEAALSHAERTGRVFGASLEKVMAGAETLPASTLRRFFAATDAELLHMYGPTETAIAVTGWTCPRDRVPARVPLGRPMPGVQLYVLDPGLRPVPRGAWGELYVGGTCVGRGYLGQPAETAAAFVPDPFSGVPAARLYRTGDMVRINHERLLEFRGRLDDQVKVRGFRIELGEVEAAMTRHPSVRQAAVVARRSPGSGAQRLAGYVSASGPDLTEEALRDHLRTCLPDYMIPSWLAILPGLPLSANGKIDRGQLPAPGPRPPAAGGSGTPGEQAVADVLAAVLERDGIGPDDDLFALGGHSLQVPQIAALIAERTGVEVPLREIFLDPTVAGIARAVERAGAAPVPAIPRVDRAARRRPAATS